ncbi:hydroxymethylglutaryl-CoA lyase [Longimonas halophila]|uniref:Hydroxymethylglutaryl-CoA lyase n=1 Tax=Longimonas halophila TaxID=1469170 RepID=A0A2H3NMC6_9BACT|nr:hydroxymethylglutaryl-CoA lyase [Longimonas halophila]PEN05786.1 hydroxymethylglutaryl-CoA lyase [Longimonas halophila]
MARHDLSPSALPSHVTLCEVGPRDGFQFEDTFIPTEEKVASIIALADAGLPRIQVTSFVHPDWVPQMRDAEAVCAALPDRDDVTYTGLVLNMAGLERALDTNLQHVDLSIATHDRHSRDNANMTVDEAIEQAEQMIGTALHAGVNVQLGFQTVFGYQEPGDTPLEQVVEMARHFADYNLESLSLADSTGMANPRMIQERVTAVQEVVGDTPLVLHLHDTRGLGLANVMEALSCGIHWFDASLAGMGGCPFIPGATGNIATEDTVYLLDQLGIDTGVNGRAVAEVSHRLENLLDKEFAGTMHRLWGREVMA